MAENQPKTKKEMFGERLRGKHPDTEFADDEAMYGQINDDYDDYEKSLDEYKNREKTITDLFDKDKRSARFITDMANGVDPFIGVIENLGIEGVTDLINDPSKQEAYAEANKKYLERLAKEKDLSDEFEKNISESMASLDQMQTERGLDDNTVNAAMAMLINIANDAIVGKFSTDAIELALKAVNHDADVENARSEGTVAGRNAKIEEQLRKPKSGDGMPNLGGANNVQTQRQQKRSMFDIAADAR